MGALGSMKMFGAPLCFLFFWGEGGCISVVVVVVVVAVVVVVVVVVVAVAVVVVVVVTRSHFGSLNAQAQLRDLELQGSKTMPLMYTVAPVPPGRERPWEALFLSHHTITAKPEPTPGRGRGRGRQDGSETLVKSKALSNREQVHHL